ncbi:MAG: hypothetical protein ABI675_15125 [Chitinophagaceae bacterium]
MKKIFLFGLTVIGVGTAGYFLLRKSRKQNIQEINDILPANEKYTMDSILNRMTRQELLDTYQLIKASVTGQKELVNTALKERLKLISNKYNIFT